MLSKIIILIILFLPVFAVCRADEQADSLTRELNEIVVTSRQPATRLVGTALVTTVSGSPLQNLGTALDVLAQLPAITVNDETVTVVGKGAPDIFIDGRPVRDDNELRQLLSLDIRRVELDMAPGAEYDSSTRAVLRITTRGNFLRGLSLTDRAEIKRRRAWSGYEYIDAVYHTGPWDWNVGGTFARNNSRVRGSTVNTLLYNGEPTVVGTSQDKHMPSLNGTVKAGLNYSVGTLSFGACYRYNPERGDFSNSGSEWLDDEMPVANLITNRVRAHSHRVSVYYDHTLAGGYLLHFDGDFKSSASTDRVATVYPDASSADVASASKRSATLWAGKLYSVIPVGRGLLTVGAQATHTRTGLDFDMLNDAVSDYLPSSLTDTRQTTAAAFASWRASLGNFDLRAGLRYEFTDYALDVSGPRAGESVSRRDNLLTPDISLGYYLNERDGITLSYKMATVKPPYSQLTGSLNYVGRHEIEGGNPALRDEHMHDVQLMASWRGFVLQSDFTRSLDTYGFVKRVYDAPTLQLLMQPVNLDVSSLDIYLMWSKNVRAWMPSLTAGVHRQWLGYEGQRYDRPIFSYYIDNVITLPAGFAVTVNAWGSTGGDMHTNRFAATPFALDLSVSKSWGDNLTLRLAATDILGTQSGDWSMHTCGVSVDKRQRYDTRGVALSLTWRLHPRRDAYKGESAAQTELDRL
ncbi:MAG: outer membrane beta-barrel family protein [Bacteroidales bacterium]|nr:outer membrane beta-barrel family protein [Bacteroidales bacterium]